jgi:copper chaperone
MIAFEVNDMTCGHCVSTITKAVRAIDKGAILNIDLSNHRVVIDPTEADAQELRDAIREAGYTPIPAAANTAPAAAPKARGGCCCS